MEKEIQATSYSQFVEGQIMQMEELISNIRAGKVSWCEDCESWVPSEESRPDPWGGDWPMCIDCIADQGLDDNVLDPAEAEEDKQHLQDQGEQP
jgi:hypothetical protein